MSILRLTGKITGPEYQPKADVWASIDFNKGNASVYSVPWVPITLENVDGLLEIRKELTQR